ncbi:MAG: hypothetical protein ABI946_03900 [Chthoniobacterales bacterium]
MNDFSELETELKHLRPAAPSAHLATRVEQALRQTPSAGVLPQPAKARWNWLSLGLGAAAAAAAVLLLTRPNVEQTAPAQPTIATSTPMAAQRVVSTPRRSYVPEGVTRVVYGKRDEGLVFPGNGEQPMRRLRARSRETLQWRDANSGASLRVSYPTEEVELIPAAGQ